MLHESYKFCNLHNNLTSFCHNKTNHTIYNIKYQGNTNNNKSRWLTFFYAVDVPDLLSGLAHEHFDLLYAFALSRSIGSQGSGTALSALCWSVHQIALSVSGLRFEYMESSCWTKWIAVQQICSMGRALSLCAHLTSRLGIISVTTHPLALAKRWDNDD